MAAKSSSCTASATATILGVTAASIVAAKAYHRRSRTSEPPVCLDYNASCVKPCPACRQLSQPSCLRCKRARVACATSLSNLTRRPLKWLHIPKCGATLAVSVLSYACGDLDLPRWHIVGMALRGGRADVRMARALDARSRGRGSRCGGRLLLPIDGHRPLSSLDVQRGGLVAMFRKPSQRIISACAHIRAHVNATGTDSAADACTTAIACARTPQRAAMRTT